MALKQELMASGQSASEASKLGFDASATLTATGSNQAGAAALVSNFTNVNAGTGGVILTQSHQMAGVINTSGGSINVYPPSGSSINATAANTAFAVGNNKQALFIPAGTNWIAILSA